MVVDVFNKINGKYKIKLVIIDDELVLVKVIVVVEKLVGEGVLVIIGGYGFNNIVLVVDVVGKVGLVYMIFGGVDDNLVNSGCKNFFCINNVVGY